MVRPRHQKPGARHALKIGKSGTNRDRESASRAYDFLREAWCSCDAAAAECQLRRVIDALAGLPSAIDTLTGAPASRAREPPPFIYKAVVVLSQAQILD